MPQLATRQSAPTVIRDSLALPPKRPDIPDDVLERFPSLRTWKEADSQWWTKTFYALQDANSTISQTTTKTIKSTDVLGVSITTETKKRQAADGFLEGKYVLTVAAGNVVTGMEITSSTSDNAGTVSEVAFQADKFQIYSGAGKKVMFVADAVQDKVRIGSVLTVDTSGSSIYVKTTIGAGAYNDANTPFFVDSTGRMSLKDKLTWDGTTLTITGSISATTGTIGGWTIGATTISKNNAILDSAGQLVLGTANDVVYLSATDATYRVWAGNATAGTANFSVTKNGQLFSTSGSIGGFGISATALTATGAFGIFTLQANTGWISITNSTSSNLLLTSEALIIDAALASDVVVFKNYTTSAASFVVTAAGKIEWGSGAAFSVVDTNLYRSAPNTLKTDGTFVAGVGFSGPGSALTALNAANISSGTLTNARLPSAISVTSLATANFFANSGAVSVDFAGANLRGFSDAARTSQTFRVDASTGFIYVAGNQVVGGRGTRGAAGLTEVVALLDAWQAWA